MKQLARAEAKIGQTCPFRLEGKHLSGRICRIDKVNSRVQMHVPFRTSPGFKVWVHVKEIDLR